MKLQKYLLTKLKKLDCLAFSNNATGFGMRGIPDVTVISKHGVLFIEIKDIKTNDRLSELQKYRIQQIINYDVPVLILHTQDEVDDFIKALALKPKKDV